MKFRSMIAVALLFLLAGGAFADGRWLHVFVEELSDGGEKVHVNLPLDLVSAVLPMIDVDELSGGEISLCSDEISVEQLRVAWAEVQKVDEGEFVRVEGVDENVRVSKKGDFLLVEVREDDERVDVRLHTSVIDGLLKGDGDTLDLEAAINALGDHGQGDLVSVHGDDELVRIWVDNKSDGS